MAKHAVNVVDVPVLPASIVLAVFVHGDLWTIENTRLERERERERDGGGERDRRKGGWEERERE